MTLYPRVAQLLAAIVVLCAAWLMPSLASAHVGHAHPGHSHHAAATTETTAAPAAQPADTAPAVVASTEIVRATTVAPIDGADVDGGNSGCAGHCSGAAAGMTCCGAVLAPEITIAPTFTSSQLLLFKNASVLLALPPEALPKPPKSFA